MIFSSSSDILRNVKNISVCIVQIQSSTAAVGLSQQSGEEEKRVAVWCTKQCRHGFGLRKTNKQTKQNHKVGRQWEYYGINFGQ